MAENKNQSYASWPSVSGSRTTDGIDLRGLNPVMAQRREMLRAYQQRLAGDVAATRQISDLNSRLTKIAQDLGASSIARQESLIASRQANYQRMMELYGNYFQQFGNVLNKDALDFLDQHSNIKVPTLTAIMAGYEHARASQAEQQLAMLDRQAKMAEAAYALDKQRADLEALKEANDALLQQQNLKNQADAVTAINKSQSQYLTDVAEKVYGGRGVAGGRGTGVAGAGGLGSGSAAGSFQAPVTGGTGAAGTGAVADGGATGVFNPNSPEFLAAQKQIADSKAAQTAGQGVQYGPLTQREIDIDKQITTFGDFGNTRNLAITSIAAPIVGGALTSYGSRAQLGYLDKQGKAIYDIANSDYMNFKNQTDIARLNLEAEEANIRRLARNDPRFSRHANMERYLRGIERRNELRMDYMRRGIPIPRGLQDSPIEAQIRNRLLNANNLRSSLASATITERQGLQARNLIADQFLGGQSKIDMANKATAFQRGRGLIARGAGKLASKVLGPVSWALTTLDLADEVYGGGAAIGRWLRNTGEDLLGVTTERLRQDPNYLENRITPGQEFDRRRNAFLAGENILLNRISGGRWNVGLENDIANMTIKRMRELGYEPSANEITQISMNVDRNEQDSANALEALLGAQGDGSGNLAGTNDSIIKFYNDVLAESAYQRTYATQVNKAAQNQQLTNQQAAEETEKANMIDHRTHRFLAAMMKHYTDMGRQAGYDFHEGHAIQFANAYMQFVADMESGNKQGAVGSMTSTGTAKSRYQFMDKTFQSAVQWMLDEDERAGNQLLNSNEREILREARTKDANFLDNNGYGNLLGFMTLLYPLKSSVSASKFGSGNPDITGQQMVVDMIQQFKNGGGMTPYLLSNMGAAYSGALHGRMGKKEYANNQNRVTALIQSIYGPDHVATGVYMPNAQIGEFLGNQGIQWDMRYDPVVWRNQWVAENFDKNEKGDDLVPKSTYKPYEQWKIDNGLNQIRQVGKPEQITMSQYIKRLNDKVDFDNLDPLVKRQLNAMAEEVGKYGKSVQLNSGRRDPAKNDELIRRWESGDREGMVHKPSKNSKHLIGTAFDMQRSGPNGLDEIVNNIPELKQKYGDARGMMAAYGFDNNVKNDPVHFSLNENFRKNNSRNSGWTLPSVASLPFAPVEYPEVVVEPANQGIVDPLDLSAFDGMMSGGVNFSPTDYGVAMEQLQQYIPENQ